MNTPKQPDLFAPRTPALFEIAPDNPNVTMLVRLLEDRDWIRASQLCVDFGKQVTDGNKRWVRALADASRGRVAGGQKGYKLVGAMTHAEFQSWKNWMTKQSQEMQRRVVEASRVFYANKPQELA